MDEEIKYTTMNKALHLKLKAAPDSIDEVVDDMLQRQNNMEASNIIKASAMHKVATDAIENPACSYYFCCRVGMHLEKLMKN
jgi:hypothetical protein